VIYIFMQKIWTSF